jgi:hypothetical protein
MSALGGSADLLAASLRRIGDVLVVSALVAEERSSENTIGMRQPSVSRNLGTAGMEKVVLFAALVIGLFTKGEREQSFLFGIACGITVALLL